MKIFTSLTLSLLLGATAIPAMAQETVGGATLFTPSQLNTMSLMTVTWDYRELELGNREATLTLPDGSTVDYKGVASYETKDDKPGMSKTRAYADNAFQVIFFPTVYTEPGEYTLTVAEGAVLIDGIPNAEQSFVTTLVPEERENPQDYMPAAELFMPNGYYSTTVPTSVMITWNQAYTLVDPLTDEYTRDLYRNVYVSFDNGNPIEVPGFYYRLENWEDPSGETDDYLLEAALYNIDGIWDMTASTVDVIIPAGIAENSEGEINPEQTLTFYILPAYTDWTLTPESGSDISADDAKITVDFGGNPISYLQGVVSATDSEYKAVFLEFGNQVSIDDDNRLVVDLASLGVGFCEVIIPEGYVSVEVEGEVLLSPSLWLEYTVTEGNGGGDEPDTPDTPDGPESGVNGINAENGITVFNILGSKVMETNDPAALRSLRQGIYIVNGRKMVVK